MRTRREFVAGLCGAAAWPIAARGQQAAKYTIGHFSAFDSALPAAAQQRLRALITVEDPLTYSHRKRIADFAASNWLPAIYGLREYVEAGGLLSYGASQADLYRRAAGYVEKILKGAKPADLPVEQPTKFELVINLKTAKTLGLDVPSSLLARADEVIE